MPYIEKYKRDGLTPYHVPIMDAGDLNFAITKMCLAFLEQTGTRYSSINAIVGVLECAKLEFYRRLAAPYEDVKKATNGDVYP